ncbi:MAG: hypothetical protein NTW21_14525 [Verrucomicrobia bacterium]|nr:hypothetical protein [Verrucomicrobiota bacterium]
MSFPKYFPLPALAWLSLGLLVPAGLFAQEANKKIRICVCAVDIAGDLSTLHLASGGKPAAKTVKWLDIPLNVFTVSQPIEVEGPRMLNFLAAATPDTQPVASVRLPGDASSYLLVFVPNKEANGYRVIPIADHAFPYGSFFLVNCSKTRLAVNIAEQKRLLKPGEQANVPGANGKSQDVSIHASINDQVRLIRSTRWQLDDNQREVVLFYDQPGTDLVRSKHIVATRATEPKPGK